MSVNFNFEGMINRVGIDEYNRLTDHPTEEGKWHPIVNTLVQLSMICDFNKITEDNWEKVADRIGQYEQAFGPSLAFDPESYPDFPKNGLRFTREDVKLFIGYTVNVTPTSDAKWKTKLCNMILDEAKRNMNSNKGTATERITEAMPKVAAKYKKEQAEKAA